MAENIAVVADSEAIEGPHQLRVGLRRLRTALAVFDPALGSPASQPLAETAKRLGRVAGQLRDADVLADELVAGALALGPDPAAQAALTAALAARRAKVRARVRATLAAPETTRFLLDLGAFIEGRGWLLPSDYSQTARLAAPIGEVAPAMLDKRHGKALKRGRRIRGLDDEGLHALRKELKKLRYAVDMLGPIYKESRVDGYLKQLRELQDTFGSLNDAAMAAAELGGPDAPHRARPRRPARGRLGARRARRARRGRSPEALRPLGPAGEGAALLGLTRRRFPVAGRAADVLTGRKASGREP